MCPIWPLHLIIIYLLALCPIWVLCQAAPRFQASFYPQQIELQMEVEAEFNVNITGLSDKGLQAGDPIIIRSDKDHIAAVDQHTYILDATDIKRNRWTGTFKLLGQFLGRTHVFVGAVRSTSEHWANETLSVTVTRPKRVIDTVFTSSVATFVSLIFINFGCAMHWPTVRDVLRKPIGPCIGMLGQFLLMPLVSFGLGYLIFPNDAAMRLGMFFTGVSPAGGASNIWTYILGGNLNLSLAMTAISTVASLGLMPIWLFSLGQVVFDNANIVVPYRNILTFVVALVVPLSIGLAMQRYTPRAAGFMVRILKGFSTTLLLFIIVFAIVTNLYIFRLFTFEIVLAGMGIPWLGYIIGYILSVMFRQDHPDSLAISIETGIQNTGISIYLLRSALEQPEADLTTVIPVAVAIMTPIPMTCIYVYQKILSCISNRREHKKIINEDSPISETPEHRVSAIMIEK